MLVLGRADVERLLSRAQARDAVRQGALAYSSGGVVIPSRSRLDISTVDADVLVMPGYLPTMPVLGMKVITHFPHNAARGLPTSPGVLLLLEPDTGVPAALLDAEYLTDIRTAAMTAVACEYLARQDSRVLGLVGTGAQARAHVAAIADVLPIDEVRVWSRTEARVRAFVDDVSSPAVRVIAAESAEAVVRGADVVVAATTASAPVIRSSWVAGGMLVCGVGSHTPDDAEIDPAIVAGAAVVGVDTWQGGVDGAGDIGAPLGDGLIAKDVIHELGEFVSRSCEGRRSADEVTVFKSVGFAAADLVAATMVLERARELGVGREVAL